MSHIPVLLNEILAFARETKRPILRLYDGTFGRGGHTRALLENFSQASALAFDRDPDAISYAEKEFAELISSGRLLVKHKDYRDFSPEDGKFDFMLLDLGVSSPQLDVAERGFSFYQDGPLDMRMDLTQEFTAADFVNTASEDELKRVFKEYGEIPKPWRVIRAIMHDRKTELFTTTRQLAGLIERVDGWRIKGQHPATKYFMALRLVVNQELEGVEEALPKLMASLNEGGRLAVITFHSLEDRIVKNIFRSSELGEPVVRKVVTAGDEELAVNSRSRSAKLRIFERNLPFV